MHDAACTVLVALTAFFSLKAFLKSPKVTNLAPPQTLYVLGDSQVANGHFIRRLNDRTATQVYGGGVGGWGIAALRKKFVPEILRTNPEMVLLWAGVNDISSRRGGEYVRDQALKLEQEVSPIPVVVVTIPAWGGWRNPRAPGLQAETIRANDLLRADLATVDASPLSSTWDRLNPTYTNEGLHFNRAGHEALADLVIKRLNLPKLNSRQP